MRQASPTGRRQKALWLGFERSRDGERYSMDGDLTPA
jgi:hypothetical protein